MYFFSIFSELNVFKNERRGLISFGHWHFLFIQFNFKVVCLKCFISNYMFSLCGRMHKIRLNKLSMTCTQIHICERTYAWTHKPHRYSTTYSIYLKNCLFKWRERIPFKTFWYCEEREKTRCHISAHSIIYL